MAIINKATIVNLMIAKKITVTCLIVASFMLAIASSNTSNNLQFADAHESGDKGEVEFIVQFGTSDVDTANDISVDPSGGVYVVGFTDNTLPGQTNEGNRDAFIRKYNSDGDQEWTRQFGTSENDEANGVYADSSGGVYVVGETFGTFPGQTNEGGADAFIRKYNSDGDQEWTRQFGTSENDAARRVSADSSGDVYVVGETFGTFPGQTNEGNRDAFIRKYNSDGDQEWTRQFGTSDEFDQANDVFADSSGDVYVVGTTGGTFPGQTNEDLIDAYIRKYNSDGDQEWTRQFGTSGRDAASGVSGDSSGVYVVGFTEEENVVGSDDAFIRKYNSDGDQEWTRQFGTSENDEARGVSVDSSGVYVAGATGGEFPGETSLGDGDIFVRKYNSDGDQEWTRQFGTSEFDFIDNGVSVDSSGVYVAGQTSGTFSGQTSAGDVDAFLAKLAIDDDDKKEHDDHKKKKNHNDGDAKKKH